MPLTLLTGPAGSGKTGEVLDRFAAALEGEPVLVVPTRADVERFEDELLARRPVALGGRIVTFERLFEMVAAATGLVAPAPLGRWQRRAVLAAVVDAAPLETLAPAARRPGFVDALDRLVADAQASLVGPEALERVASSRRAGSRGPHLREVAALYRAYVERREALGRSDPHSLAAAAVAALRRAPEAWGDRPLLVHGFDDLTAAQLAVVEGVCGRAQTLVSVVHEPGRACLRARERLVREVQELGETGRSQLSLDAAKPRVERIELAPAGGTGTLAHLERGFMAEAPQRREPDGELRLLAAGGVRGEIEQVGAAIAALLRGGTHPDQIAVIARSPDTSAGLVAEVLEGFGVPVAVQAERALARTAGGAALLALLRAALTTRSAADVVAFLRAPGCAPAGRVDRLEREVRRAGHESAEEALAAWERVGGRRPWEIDDLRAAADRGGPALVERVAAVARSLFERRHLRSAPALNGPERADLGAADAVAGALEEIAALAVLDAALAPPAAALLALVEAVRVPCSSPTVAGRVEVMSPYRARARQFAHVFVLSLQEGEFPRRRSEDPFLTDGERLAAGLAARADASDEERYLFYVCLTRATRRLHLSYRTADDEGAAASRSFLVDEVLDLLAPEAEAAITRSRGLSDTVFRPAEAPTERELARTLAERGPVSAAAGSLTTRLEAELRRAAARSLRLPGSVQVPFVRARLAERTRIGASSLEQYAECPFRWFVDHELRPRELAPDPEPLARGAAVHRVLERLYAERGRPDPGTVDAACERSRELLRETTRGTSLDPERAAARAVHRRMESDIARYLRYDARHAGDGRVALVEAGFGTDRGEDSDHEQPLVLEGFELHGKIDRVDLVGPGQALIRDYKTGTKVASRKEASERKRLQLPLYMLAVRELWGLEPVGGVYHPLGKQHAAVARGVLRGPQSSSPLGEPFPRTDWTADEDEFEATLARARAEAEAIATAMREGRLARAPLGGSCPAHCDFHPICRRERGAKNPEENGAPTDAMAEAEDD